MTNDDEMPWSPAAFASQFQRASEEFSDQQMQMFEQMLSAGGMRSGADRSKKSVGDVDPMNAAVFKTRVQSGGRISIPDAEREALDIDEGDLVQTFVIPIKRTRSDSNE